MNDEYLDLTPTPVVLETMGNIDFAIWQCVAELVDNSLDDLRANRVRSDAEPLVVKIELSGNPNRSFLLTVSDNGGGLDKEQMNNSLKAGYSNKNRYGALGLFGVGFNIATARLGHVTTVRSKQRGVSAYNECTVDLRAMQSQDNFRAPFRTGDDDVEVSGTSVQVELKPETARKISDPKEKDHIRRQLGTVYSFLLRSGVPGLNGDDVSGQIPVEIWFDGVQVAPRLPCVWSDKRSVSYKGQEIGAIQYVDQSLEAAFACLECGAWDRKPDPETCDACGSKQLRIMERRVHGWVGVQRYLDTNDYGIDFLRNGRKILLQDKSIFTFRDPDTAKVDNEYPIDVPANKGRLVGEIHLDHVPVTYMKDDFDRNSRDWMTAVEIVRGNTGLKPANQKDGPNDSPLGLVFRAYRRNTQGRRFLIPGSPERRDFNAKAAEWGEFFHKGIERYQTDSEWWDAVIAVENTDPKTPGGGDDEDPGSSETDPRNPAGDGPGGAIGKFFGGESGQAHVDTPKPTKTIDETFKELRLHSRERNDLSGVFKLGKALGDWEITFYTTQAELPSDGKDAPPLLARLLAEQHVEIFLGSNHRIFGEYDRSILDLGLLSAAEIIATQGGNEQTVLNVFTDMIMSLEDERLTRIALVDLVADLKRRLAEQMIHTSSGDDLVMWSLVPADSKQDIEVLSATTYPDDRFETVTRDARFMYLLDLHAIAAMLQQRPELFFDSKVFRPALQGRSEPAVERLVASIVNPLEGLHAFESDDQADSRYDLQRARLDIEYLNEKLAEEA